MSDQKVCPTCGTEYPLSERFCPRDGSALRATSAGGSLEGTIIAERYHVLKKLGEGGMGTVYLAEHVKMGRKAALKVMNPGMNQDADAIARFNREAANASRLNHPNVCAIYDFGETPEGLIYLAMEFIEGDSLTKVVETNGALPSQRAANIIHQAADALAVAHDYGIVHRDLKPDNIMIAKNRDGSDQVKVVDFGIAKASSSDAQKVTKTGLVVGTPEYMSPEQLAGDKLDGRSDIYSLALVAFNCFTGTLPFPSDSQQESMIMRLTDRPRTLTEMKSDTHWPPELQAVMDKALARDAKDRYASAAEFGRDLVKSVERMPQGATADAGSMVMSAPAVAAGAGAIPATRVAAAAERGGGAGGATPPPVGAVSAPASQAPAAPAVSGAVKKSPLVPILIGALVLAGGGGAYFAMNGKGATKAADPGGATTSVVKPPVPADTGKKIAGGTKVTDRPGTPTTPGQNAPRPVPNAAADNSRELDRIEVLATTENNGAANRQAQQGIEALLPKLSTPAEVLRGKYIHGLALYNSDAVVTAQVKRGCDIWKGIRTEAKGRDFASAIEGAFEVGSCKGL